RKTKTDLKISICCVIQTVPLFQWSLHINLNNITPINLEVLKRPKLQLQGEFIAFDPIDQTQLFSLQMEALQLVKFSDDGSKVELNHTTLEKALHHVRDHRVVIVSVVGAYRRGKSFLLNFLLRYLKAQGSEKWLSDMESKVEGFSWRFDVNRVTTGIMLWPQAFIINDIAVLLLDTQGTFDNVTTFQESTAIVAITALISSITIFNMSERIESKDLDNLRYFLEYGGLAYEQTGSSKQSPFQQTIFLEKEDLRNVKENLEKCFEKTSCFLMPFPGGKVARDRNFQGKLGDINKNFLDELKVLVESMISQKKLEPKHLGEHDVLARDLPELFHSLTLAFNSDKLPTPTTLLQMFSKTVAKRMVHQAHATYEKKMNEHMKGRKVVENLDDIHNKLIEKSYKEYVVRLNEDRKRIAEAEKNVEILSQQIKEKEVEKVKMEQEVKEVDTKLHEKKEETENLTQLLTTKQMQIQMKETKVKSQEEILKKEQETYDNLSRENANVEKELERAEEIKKSALKFFNDIVEICQSFMMKNQSLTTFDLFSAILTKLMKKNHSCKTVGELIRGYESVQSTLVENDPVHTIVTGFIAQLRETDTNNDEVPKEHLAEFVKVIQSLASNLE
ncbi:hypothetical protein B566_EDAN001638, partial [Ephemera danica]